MVTALPAGGGTLLPPNAGPSLPIFLPLFLPSLPPSTPFLFQRLFGWGQLDHQQNFTWRIRKAVTTVSLDPIALMPRSQCLLLFYLTKGRSHARRSAMSLAWMLHGRKLNGENYVLLRTLK